eukprot:COSAG01_NODE_20708_length_939_cov_1.083333_1_plen_47_part_10
MWVGGVFPPRSGRLTEMAARGVTAHRKGTATVAAHSRREPANYAGKH